MSSWNYTFAAENMCGFKIFLKTLPSIKCDEIISCGPAKTPIQAVKTIPFILSLIGLKNTCPRAQVKAPSKTK